jgi:hypothetical protein
VDGQTDRRDRARKHTHTVEKSIATQNVMIYASELMVALVHKDTILILMVGIKNSGGVVVCNGMISYQVSQTNDAISLPFPIKKWKIKSS